MEKNTNREYTAPVAIVISFDMSDIITASSFEGEYVPFRNDKGDTDITNYGA